MGPHGGAEERHSPQSPPQRIQQRALPSACSAGPAPAPPRRVSGLRSSTLRSPCADAAGDVSAAQRSPRALCPGSALPMLKASQRCPNPQLRQSAAGRLTAAQEQPRRQAGALQGPQADQHGALPRPAAQLDATPATGAAWCKASDQDQPASLPQPAAGSWKLPQPREPHLLAPGAGVRAGSSVQVRAAVLAQGVPQLAHAARDRTHEAAPPPVVAPHWPAHPHAASNALCAAQAGVAASPSTGLVQKLRSRTCRDPLAVRTPAPGSHRGMQPQMGAGI